jgi:DNA-binding NarL/FixJ family response regulator
VQGDVRLVVGSRHPVMREGLVSMIGRDRQLVVTGQVDSVEAIVAAVVEQAPAMVVVAHEPPSLDAAAISRLLGGKAGVVALTGEVQHRELLEMIESGVRAVLMDTTPSADLPAMLHTVAAGSMVFGVPSLTTAIDQVVRRSATSFDELATELHTLTRRQFDVLVQVALGKSNRQIAHDLCVSEATVKSHLYHLCRKLDIAERTQLVVLAYELGVIPSPWSRVGPGVRPWLTRLTE